ncbi:34356_t:CDS:2, partial [Racocetra persica]
LQAHDHAIMARRAHHSSGIEIALKLLAPYNNTSEIHLRHVHEEAIMMGKEYRNFVYSLPLDNNIKDLLASDLEINWICDEWRQCFIDGGRALHAYDLANTKPMTTNNLTECMHKTVETRRSGTQTVISFIEHLYSIKILRDSLVQNELGETSFNAGLITYWNMRTIEHKQFPHKKPIDLKHRINQGHLYVLLGLVMPVIGHENYMFVKK